MTIEELRKKTKEYLLAHPEFGDADSIFNTIMYHFQDEGINEDDYETNLMPILDQISEGKPVQYILGSAYFYGLKFKVNQHTLIPRQETEQLASEIVQELKTCSNLNILDIGTGSGCLPISIAHKLGQQNKYYGVDIDSQTLLLAQSNAFKLDTNVTFINIDFLDEHQWDLLPKTDILISNPPYIPIADHATMDKHVTQYEPQKALFVPNSNPLIFYKKLCDYIDQRMVNGSKGFFEINSDLSQQTLALFQTYNFSEILLKEDWYQLPRFIWVIK